MKTVINSFPKATILLLFFTLLFISCEKESKKPETTYLVSSELLVTYSANQVLSSMTAASILYPDLDTLLKDFYLGVKIYKVSYKTHLGDEEVIASGIISVPSDESAFPILSFQNGTNTCYSNAPSENSFSGLFSLISLAAGSGYIVTIPDYIGFGESKSILHPYHHRQSSDNAIIDLILATRELLDIKEEASFNGNLYLMGYSQGGWASCSALNTLEKTPHAGIIPVAADFGAGAYDIYEMGKYIVNATEYPNPFYLPYFIESRIANGIISDPLALYFKEPYAGKTSDLFNGQYCNDEMNEQYPQNIDSLLTPQLISEFETASEFETLRQQLKTNSIPAWNLSTPVRIYHSTGDKSVPSFESQLLYDNFIALGVPTGKISLVMVQDLSLDHSDAVVPWGIDALSWFASLK